MGCQKLQKGENSVKQRAEEREPEEERRQEARKPSPQERTRQAVYATGNKWAIENFKATHN